MRIRISRAALAVVAIGALAAGACSSGGDGDPSDSRPWAGTELVVTSFGGDWEAAFIEAVVEPFEEETGAEVTLVTLYSADALAQLTAQASSPQFDVVHFSGGQEVVAAEEGLIEPIAAADLSNYDELQPVAVARLEEGEGPVVQVTPVGLVFRTDAGVDAPDSWLDVFDSAYAGHVALTDFSNTYGVLAMLRIADALGGGIDDTDEAIERLGTLASTGDAIVVASSPDLQAALAQRDIWLAPYAQDYASTLADAGLPVEFIIPEEGLTASFITANVVSGRPNTELAKLFLNYELRAEAQAIFAERMRYAPVNTTTELPADVAGTVLSADDFATLVRYDAATIAANRQAWTDDWNSRISQ